MAIFTVGIFGILFIYAHRKFQDQRINRGRARWAALYGQRESPYNTCWFVVRLNCTLPTATIEEKTGHLPVIKKKIRLALYKI